ncbi:MAG: diacylglycerol/polyprenol kinase family protein [Nanoarchaeota archaeon]
MSWDFKRELARKVIHLLSIFILLIYFGVSLKFGENVALIALTFILILFIEVEYLRLEWVKNLPLLKRIWNYVLREKEKDKIGGDIFFLIGAILVLAVFDTKIAVTAILMTIFGDLSAALFGSRFGHNYLTRFPEKAWEGIFAELIVNIIVGFVVLISLFEMSLFVALPVLFIMSVTATFVETIVTRIDDNLLIPLFSGFNGQVIFFLIMLLH